MLPDCKNNNRIIHNYLEKDNEYKNLDFVAFDALNLLVNYIMRIIEFYVDKNEMKDDIWCT